MLLTSAHQHVTRHRCQHFLMSLYHIVHIARLDVDPMNI